MKTNQITLLTGKGGVGRTTLAAALAQYQALNGKRTLLLEIDDEGGDEGSGEAVEKGGPYYFSPLARRFHRERFSVEPEALQAGLWGMRLDSRKGQELFLASILKVQTFAKVAMSVEPLIRFLQAAPSFREMGIFYHFLHAVREGFDAVILDLPATGHALGLTRLPQILLKLMSVGPLVDSLKEGQALLYNPEITSTWVVTLPEALPVSEALELYSGLIENGLPVAGFWMNRMTENPFDAMEQAQIDRWVAMGKPFRGILEYQRLRNAENCLARLQKESNKPIWVFPEVSGELDLYELMKSAQECK